MFDQVGLPNIQNIASGLVGGFIPQVSQNHNSPLGNLTQLLGGGALGAGAALGRTMGSGLLGTLLGGPVGGLAGAVLGGGMPGMLAKTLQNRMMGNMQGNQWQPNQYSQQSTPFNSPLLNNAGIPQTSNGGTNIGLAYNWMMNNRQPNTQQTPYLNKPNISDQPIHLQKPMIPGSYMSNDSYVKNAW